MKTFPIAVRVKYFDEIEQKNRTEYIILYAETFSAAVEHLERYYGTLNLISFTMKEIGDFDTPYHITKEQYNEL